MKTNKQINNAYKLNLDIFMKEFQKKNKELNSLAEELMNTTTDETEKMLYKVSINGFEFWIVAINREHPAILQRIIELYMNNTFDEMKWDYLTLADVYKTCRLSKYNTNPPINTVVCYIG